MNMHACTGNSSRPKSKPKKCPPAPPSSPRRPARKADPPNAPPQWVPIDTPSTIPRPLLEEPNSYDGSGASWGSAFNDSVAPFGFWDSEGRAEKRSFDLPSSSAHSSSSKPSSSTPDEVNNDQLYVGDAPAFLSAIPQFADGDTIIPSPKPLQAEKSDFACSDEEEDHDEFAEEEEEAFDDEDDDYETKKRASSSSQQKAQGVASSAGANKLDGRTFAADMTVYVVSGILLIFVMEQFVQIGMRLN